MYSCPTCYSVNTRLEDYPYEFFVAVSCLDCSHTWNQELDEAGCDYHASQLQRKRKGDNIRVTTRSREYLLTKNDYPRQGWKLFSLKQTGVNPDQERHFIGQFNSLERIHTLLGQTK